MKPNMAPENTSTDAIQFHSQVPLWRDERVLRIAAQIISAIVVIGLLYWGITNVINAAEQRGLSLGFDFLQEAAGFPIGESDLPYDSSSSFLYAFLVGLLNTLKVSIGGGFLRYDPGNSCRYSSFIQQLARQPDSTGLYRIAPQYTIDWSYYYSGIGDFFTRLPDVEDSIILPGPMYLSQRGLQLTLPRFDTNRFTICDLGRHRGDFGDRGLGITCAECKRGPVAALIFAYISLGLLVIIPGDWFDHRRRRSVRG